MPRQARRLGDHGFFHLTTRGNNRRVVFHDVPDRQVFLAKLQQSADRCEWSVLSWCQMGNHYHLLLQCEPARLAPGMRYLNGSYAMHFNRRHGRTGHLWEDRFDLRNVESERQLWATFRYIARNPVEHGFCDHASDWVWSAHRALGGARDTDVVAVDTALGLLGPDVVRARDAYERLAGATAPDAPGEPSLWRPSLAQVFDRHGRDLATAVAVVDLGYSIRELAEAFDVGTATVHRWLRAGRFERERGTVPLSS